jgi:hypothetical protein
MATPRPRETSRPPAEVFADDAPLFALARDVLIYRPDQVPDAWRKPQARAHAY